MIDDHNHDDDESDDEPIVERRARDLRQRVAQHAEDERPEHRADDRSAAARQAGPADDGRRNDIQLVAGCEIGFSLPLDEDQHDTRDRRERPEINTRTS